MIIKNLPPEEVSTVMGYMRQAVKDTYFEKWLRSGGFRWPIDSVLTTKVSSEKGLVRYFVVYRGGAYSIVV